MLACLLAALAAPSTSLGQAAPEPYQTGDFLGFRNILPPGTDGTANGAEISQFLLAGTYPAGWVNQASLYERLVYFAPGLSNAQVDDFYKDGSFGTAPGNVASTNSPPMRPGVVIQRDNSYGVPHVYGETRGDTIYGAGYASAEDRLFFMDVLRHAGRGNLSAFAGGSNREMDIEQWQLAPYSEADLQTQAERLDDLYGADGAQIQADAQNYVDGINAYIDEALINPTKMPGEYAAIGQQPQPFTPTDVIATASLIGGIFGKGGGGELNNALVMQAAQRRFGKSVGKGVWKDFRSAEDPEAPTTVHNGGRFSYQTGRGVIRPDAVAMPDRGSLTGADGTGSASAAALGAAPEVRGGLADGMKLKPGNSNALLVSGAHTDSGRPIAVFGPQVAYFIPEILQELDLHCIDACAGGPDIDARGASFPGISPYILLGRGKDYAWSATSAGQDIIDTFAEQLCNPNGSKPSLTTNNYLYKGNCVPMEVLQQTNNVTPNPGDQCGPPENPCGPFTTTSYRTVHGIVSARGKVGGKPVAFARERSTYMHEVDSARAFIDLNSPDRVDDAQSFQQAASKIGFTFNWFYTDDQDIAYFNSGDNPVRARGTDPELPTWGTGHYDWQGFNPTLRTASYTPFSQHPQVIDQDYITSWNNKQAPEFRAAEDNYAYGPIHRSLSLDHRVQQGLSGGGTIDRPELVDAMEDAGTVDLRGAEVLPYMLDVIGTPSNPALATAVQKLQAWVDDGAHRRANADTATSYDHPEAIAIMDAWWPRVLQAVYQPVLGQTLFDAIQRVNHFDDDPHSGSGYHVGSAYIDGWYGYLQKDLRSLLGDPVSGSYSRRYCGAGSLVSCRNILLQSLSDALAVPVSQLYDEDPATAGVQRVDTCPSGKSAQWCWDSVRFRPIGAVTYPTIHWINRPTWQQVVQVQGHRPR